MTEKFKFNLGEEVYQYSTNKIGIIVGVSHKDHSRLYVDFHDSVEIVNENDLMQLDSYIESKAANTADMVGRTYVDKCMCKDPYAKVTNTDDMVNHTYVDESMYKDPYAIAAIKFVGNVADPEDSRSNSEYHYRLFNSDNYNVDDYVLCNSAIGLRLAQIQNIMTISEARKIYNKPIAASIICKVDLTDYIRRCHIATEYNQCRSKINDILEVRNINFDLDKVNELTYRMNALKDKF